MIMWKSLRAALLLGTLCFASSSVHAADAPSAATDPGLERKVMAIAEELRCLVCQNQTIADSHAELAVDLKNQVREMLLKGMTETQIKDYMVQRYGDFVLYRPPVRTSTWLLWIGPFLLLLGALIFLIFKLRARNRRIVATDDMTDEARLRAETLLAESSSDSPDFKASDTKKDYE